MNGSLRGVAQGRSMGPVIWPLAATMLVQAMVAMAVNLVPVLAPVLAGSYGIAPSLVGLYASLSFGGALIFTLLGGAVARRVGAVRCSQWALGVAGVAVAATAMGPLAGVAIFAVIAGMGYGLATPAASHILARVTPAQSRGVVFSLKQSAVPIGGLLAGLAAPLVAAWFGWQAALLCGAALVISTIAVIAPLRGALDDDRDPTFVVSANAPLHAIGLVLAEPRLRILTIATFAFAATMASIFAIYPAYLVDRGGLNLITAGQVFAALQVAGVCARVFFGWCSDRLVRATSLLSLLGLVMAVVAVAASNLNETWSVVAIVAFSILLGAVAAGWPGIYLAEVVRVVSTAQVSAATGGMVAFTFLGVVVGPALFSAIVQITKAYAPAFYVFAGTTAAASVALWLLSRRRYGNVTRPPSAT